ncbi:hypothetical protein VNO77_00611 [Canavalia gladiata]|uniref:SAUR family protein n=1 Tax=Canavalia gladiata TaxID=3824 RepID=A0AAN9MW78_CANGL
MEFVKKCKRVWGSGNKLHPENSGSYGKLRNKQKKKNDKPQVTPHGSLCVYVGAERERFVIKIKTLNHPLFKTLLDGAEREYGYRNDGPLWLPCDVDFFCEALAEMESTQDVMSSLGCTYINSHSPSSVFHTPFSDPSNLTSAAHYELLV